MEVSSVIDWFSLLVGHLFVHSFTLPACPQCSLSPGTVASSRSTERACSPCPPGALSPVTLEVEWGLGVTHPAESGGGPPLWANTE